MRETSEEGEAVAIVIARGLCRYSCCGRRGLSRGAVRLLVAVIVAEFQPSARRCWFDASGKPIDRVRVYLPNVPPPPQGGSARAASDMPPHTYTYLLSYTLRHSFTRTLLHPAVNSRYRHTSRGPPPLYKKVTLTGLVTCTCAKNECTVAEVLIDKNSPCGEAASLSSYAPPPIRACRNQR